MTNKSTVNKPLRKERTSGNFSDNQNSTLIEYPDVIDSDKNKKIRVKDIGKKFASINSFFLDYLQQYHIPTALLKHRSDNVLEYIKHYRFQFFIKMLNVTDKRTAKIFGKKEFTSLNLPVSEIHFAERKNSFISESHLIAFDLCSYEELRLMYRICSKINAVLKSFFERRNELLAEVNCIFGRADNKIFLIGDFTPLSIKIIPADLNDKMINPYKISTPAQYRKYSDHLLNILSH